MWGEMMRSKKTPRYCVVSLRVSDAEREALDEVSRLTNRNVSEVMREAMALLHRKLAGGSEEPLSFRSVPGADAHHTTERCHV